MNQGPLTMDWPLWTQPVIRLAGRFPHQDRGYRTRYLNQQTHALHVYAYRASMRFQGAAVVQLQVGDVTISPAGMETRYDLPEAGHHLCVHFMPIKGVRKVPDAARTMRLPLHLRPGVWREMVTQRMLWITQRHIASMQHPLAKIGAAAALQELLLLLGWIAEQTTADHPKREASMNLKRDQAVEAVASLIERDIAREQHIPTLASRVGTSQDYLARCFRQRFGMTLPRYVLTRRIEMAKLLLVTTDLPVGIIAGRVGMPDPQHFNKQFRRLTGMSPSAARSSRRK